MITRLEVHNFKSLNNFKIILKPFTVIVGNNASGKSSVLQALSFLMESANEDFINILGQRGWDAEDIKSKLVGSSSHLRFACEMSLQMDGVLRRFRWELSAVVSVTKNTIGLAAERIVDLDNDRALLAYSQSGKLKVCTETGENTEYPKMFLRSSVLKVIVDIDKSEYPELVAIKRFLLASTSYELLSPADMRQSSRGQAGTIGMSGKNLPSFIKSLSAEQKQRFIEKLHKVLGTGWISNVGTYTKGKPGWTRTPESVMLLDEIENGININYAEELLKMLREVYADKRHQFIVTTHSTVFVDYVDAEDVVFLFRDQNTGFTKAVRLFDVPELKSRLEYMYPGEVLLNLSNEKIISELLKRRTS